MMHLPLLKAFGWNDSRNPWPGPPIQMEMNPPRCVWCAEQWGMRIRGDYEGFSPYHPVFTGKHGLVFYAVDWRASALTEQIDKPALHSWASIYPETIDQETLVKNNNSHRRTKVLLNGKWNCFVKRSYFLKGSFFSKLKKTISFYCSEIKSWRLLGDLGINPAKVLSPLSPLLIVPPGFPSLSEQNTKRKKQLSHMQTDFFLLCYSDR